MADQRERLQHIDVAGRARLLVWGASLTLPPGAWRGTARFSVDQWACRHRYRLKWGPLRNLARCDFTPTREGVFEISSEHQWIERQRIDLRIILTEGSLGGMFEFLGAEFSAIQQAAPASAEIFQS